MRQMVITFVEISILLVVIFIFLFLFVDCKMERVQLQTKCDLSTERITDLEKELAGIRQVYSHTLLAMVADNKISMEELAAQLPEHEIKYLQTVLLKQDKKDGKQ